MKPSICSMVARSSVASARVTKPNPRERPVSRSEMTFASVTVQKASNARRSSSLVVFQLKPPTNSLLLMFILLSPWPLAKGWFETGKWPVYVGEKLAPGQDHSARDARSRRPRASAKMAQPQLLGAPRTGESPRLARWISSLLEIDVFPFTPAHQTSDSTTRAKLGNGGRQRNSTTEVARATA